MSASSDNSRKLSLASALARFMQTVLEGYLRLDPDSRTGLAKMDGKIVALELRGLEITLYLSIHDRVMDVSDAHVGIAHTRISGTPIGLAGLAMRHGSRGPLLSGDVTISGDVALGQELQSWLAGVEVDWEEQLSKVVGDIAAHQIGKSLREAGAWTRQSADALADDLTEYLQEESRYLPTRYEVEEFLAEVDTLRADIDRIEQRIHRLQRAKKRRSP